MRDFTDDLAGLRQRVDAARRYLGVDAARARLAELEEAASKPDLWDDPDEARRVTTELSRVRDDVERIDQLEQRLSDVETLHELAREEEDDSVEDEISRGVQALARALDALDSLRSRWEISSSEGVPAPPRPRRRRPRLPPRS